jgi:hypothetical protein
MANVSAAAVVGAIPRPPVVETLASLPLTTVLSASAAVFITFHKSLKCDEYQAECRRMNLAYKAFAISADAALALPDDALPDAHEHLASRLAALTKKAGATVPDRYVVSAQRTHDKRSAPRAIPETPLQRRATTM